ncbi:ead/Ea22-like family protein [Pseudomonas aeruginosa]
MTDHAELRRLAKAATPGPWTLYVPEDYQGPEELPGYGVECAEGRAIVWGALEPETGCQFDRDAEFIAAANPQAILRLIEEVEKLRADTSSMRGSLKANSKCTKKLIKDGARAAKERDRLRAENEALLLGMRAILNAYDYADQYNKEGVAVEVMEDLRTLFKGATQ